MKSTNGFRTAPKKSKNEALEALQTELSNVQMASQISQMLMKQMMTNFKALSQDMGDTLNQLYEMQYTLSALQKHLKVEPAALAEIANNQRLMDFNTSAEKEDKREGLVEAATVTKDSTITITSVATDAVGKDCGIFRSRIKLADCGIPLMIEGLMGKSVGDKITVKLNDLDHTVELLAIREPAVATPTIAELAAEVTH